MSRIFERGWELLQQLLFPQQRKWIVATLFFAGLGVLLTPVWTHYADAALEHYWGSRPPSPETTTGLGLLLMVMGLVVHFFNEYLEHRAKSAQTLAQSAPIPGALARDAADRRSLEELFSNLHLPTFDQFFVHGQQSVFYLPVLHYYFGLKDFVQSSEYHFHDEQTGNEIEALRDNLEAAISFGLYFTDSSNPDLQKFDPRRNIGVDSDANRALESFYEAVLEAKNCMGKVCRLIKSRYPDFDFKATNSAALADMQAYRRRAEEGDAKTLPESEFSVMHAIVEAESSRAHPNLKNLALMLGLPQVDVDVALDRLIERGFVKHLYPGQLHQKFTVLKLGRAYYVDHSKARAE